MKIVNQREKMIDLLKTLSAINKGETKVINCVDPIDLDLGDSDNPNLIVLNGKVSKEDFELAKELISSGGMIAFTRGNVGIIDTVSQASELYGDVADIVYDIIKNGEYFVCVKNVLLYIKGVSKDYKKKGNDWATLKGNYEIIQAHNLKARIDRFDFEVIEPKDEVVTETPKPKRKRRTKAEIEADKNGDTGTEE